MVTKRTGALTSTHWARLSTKCAKGRPPFSQTGTAGNTHRRLAAAGSRLGRSPGSLEGAPLFLRSQPPRSNAQPLQPTSSPGSDRIPVAQAQQSSSVPRLRGDSQPLPEPDPADVRVSHGVRAADYGAKTFIDERFEILEFNRPRWLLPRISRAR